MFTSFLSHYVTYLKHLIQYDGFLPVPLQRKLHYSVSVFTGDTLFPVYQVTLFITSLNIIYDSACVLWRLRHSHSIRATQVHFVVT